MKKIKHNRVQCGFCKDIIESKYVHNFVTCKCGRISVDGGKEYLKRSGDLKNFREMSEYVEERKL